MFSFFCRASLRLEISYVRRHGPGICRPMAWRPTTTPPWQPAAISPTVCCGCRSSVSSANARGRVSMRVHEHEHARACHTGTAAHLPRFTRISPSSLSLRSRFFIFVFSRFPIFRHPDRTPTQRPKRSHQRRRSRLSNAPPFDALGRRFGAQFGALHGASRRSSSTLFNDTT